MADTALRRPRPAPATRVAAGLSTPEILRFFVPLSATIMFYAVVFNVMNSAMARTAEAAAALAAFSVGKSITDIFAVAAVNGRQWLLSGGRDRRSYLASLPVLAQIVGLITILMFLAGWTRFGYWIYSGVFNAPAHLASGIQAAIRVCLPLPLVYMLRGASQSVLMLRRQTHYMTIGVVVRLGWVLAAAVMFRNLPWHGAAIGALIWVSGLGVEAVFGFFMARRLFGHLPDQSDDGKVPGADRIWRFLLPLIATSLLWSLGRPILNLGMARSATPELSIAAYQVAWNAAWLLIAYVQTGFRQVIVVFWQDQASLRILGRFATRLAVGVSVLMATLTLSGGATWFLQNVVGADAQVVASSRGVLLVLSLMPLALMATEVRIGRLLRNGTTGPVGVAKGVNLAVMAMVSFGLAWLAPTAGALIGGLGMLAGACGELAVAHLATRQQLSVPAGGDD